VGQQWLGVKGGAPEATSASRPPRRRRRTWVIASLATVWVAFVVLIAALVLWPRLAPALQYETLVAGDEVTLRSGLSLVVPDGAEGGFSHWRRMMDEAGGALEPADDVLISFGSTPSELSVGLSALWARENALVWVIIRLPDRLQGWVSISPSRAATPGAAWDEAVDVWRRLSITGADLPSRPAG